MAAAENPIPFDGDSEIEHVERVGARERRLGRYRLVYQLASGGMATVYLGRALGPAGVQRPVAIKRIHPHLARRKQFVAMFLDEARIASRISHPNVCALHDFGEIDGTYYMAMEYLVGVPLTRLVRAVSRDPARLASAQWHALATRIIADAAEGLHNAHELRDEAGVPLAIVHRDVSPQNVFVTYDGAVKVVDFGIALARDRLSQTNTGTLKGKFGYMAPEHASGGEVDRRADVWSLGVCLWEMLVGARLFRRKNEMETLLAVRSDGIEAPSTHAFGVPAELDRIVLRALERDVARRYPTARAFGRDLMELVRRRGEPTGLPDLADWMSPLFAETHSEQLELVRTVLESDVVEASRRSSSATARPGRRRERRSNRYRVLGLGAAAAALLGVGVLAGGLLREPAGATSERPVPASDSAPPESTSAPPESTSAPPESTSAPPTPPPAPETAPPTETGEVEPEEAPEATERARPEPRRRPRAVSRRRAAQRPSPPAASTPDAFGHADVVAVGGWAEIYEGRRSLGRTPTRVRLSAGSHVLTVRPFGDGPARRVRVDVPADGVARVVVPLEGGP